MTYRVRVEIDVDGDTPLEAAAEAYRTMCDPACSPWVVDVWPMPENAAASKAADGERPGVKTYDLDACLDTNLNADPDMELS